MDWLSLDPWLREALREDLGRGDLTTRAVLGTGPSPSGPAKARVVAREPFVLAGWPVFLRVFQLLGRVESEVLFQEGEQVAPGTIGTLQGDPGVLLQGERVALNFLQRLSGIATLTQRCVQQISHTGVRLLDTRKTTPLWRSLEKYAVRMGGGHNHRFGLDDGVLIKENHVTLAGGITAAVNRCRRSAGHLHKIEVEVRNLEEVQEALEAGAEVLLLDNMTPSQVRRVVELAKGKCLLEVSGGVREDNLLEYAETGVEFISLGRLTHSVRSADISLLVEAPAPS